MSGDPPDPKRASGRARAGDPEAPGRPRTKPAASFGPEPTADGADETKSGEERAAATGARADAGPPASDGTGGTGAPDVGATPSEPAVDPADAPPSEGPGRSVVQPAPSARHLSSRRGGPGVRIPGYHIEGVIGRGSTGTVYRARQENVDREVALKVLHAELTSRPRMVRRLQREARTTARLAHPHIVSAIDMGRTGERWWFAMELVDGPSLALRLRQDGRLSEREALRLFIPLCEALVHIWENGVVHRDIKPANILIDRVSGASLADLGLAFADDDPHLTGSEGTLGTPHYISPEQARDPSSVDIRTDIWSFGATLFHAVCGEPPLRGANVAEVLSGVLYGRIPDPEDLEPDLSRGLALVLRKCLTRDFDRRYQTPRELLTDLERVRERRRPKVRVASLEPTASSRLGVGRMVFAAAMLLVLGAGGTLLWKRPWAQGSGDLEYPALTALAAELEAGDAAPGTWLARLGDLRAELPASDLARWRELHAAGRERLDGALGEVLDGAEAAFEEALAAEDFGAAADALGPDIGEAMLAGTGLSMDLAGPEARTLVVRLEHRLARTLDRAEGEARATLDAALAEGLLADVDALVDRGLWSEARGRLELPPEDLPVALGLTLPDLPPERRARLLDAAGDRLLAARADLDRRWSALDAELVRWIELEQRDLEAELSATLAPIGAGGRLQEAFDFELFRRGLTAAELPVEPAGLARDRLQEAVRELEDVEGRLAASRAPSSRSTMDLVIDWLDREANGEHWRLRRYERADGFWAGRLDELQGLGDVAAYAESRERALAKRQEATLLTVLRDRAQAGLEDLDGGEAELFLGTGVRASGRLDLAAPGASGGLVLEVGADATYELYLAAPRGGLPAGARLVSARDVELLAGFDLDAVLADPGTVTPADRLTLALFRAREGDEEGALALVAGGEFVPELEALASDLRRRLERSVRALTARREARLLDAQSLLATLYLNEPDGAERLERDPARAMATIRRLRLEFADLAPVAAAAERLDELEARLESPGGKPTLADFEAAFGAGVPRFLDADTVELRYWFEGTTVPGIALEDWTPDGLNWVAPGDLIDDQDLITRPVPRLILRRPMEVTRGDLVVEFDFAEPAGAATERLVVASVAGFHLALRTAEGALRSELALSTEDLDALVAELRSNPRSLPGRLLEGDAAYRLRVEVNQQTGRVLVLLAELDPRGGDVDYRELVQDRLPSPRGRAGSVGVALRAKEALRLTSLWVRGER